MTSKECLPWPEVDKAGKPLNQAQKDLWCSAQLLKKHGWCRNVLVDRSTGAMCWLGSIHQVTTGVTQTGLRDTSRAKKRP